MKEQSVLELLDHIAPSSDEAYTVYVHVNKTNGKKYVGITKQSTKTRWQYGNGYKSCTHFGRSIKKYGWNNFEHIIYAKNLTKEDACELEVKLIAKFQSTNPEFGYNSTFGGESNIRTPEITEKIRKANIGKRLSEETRQKISKAHMGKTASAETRKKLSLAGKGKRTGKDNPMYGKPVSNETRNKISLANRGENHPNYGKNLSTEIREKISSTQRGSNSPRARKVICLTTGEQFGAISEATLKYKINKNGIIRCCQNTGRQNVAGKHLETGEPLKWAYVDSKENDNGR